MGSGSRVLVTSLLSKGWVNSGKFFLSGPRFPHMCNRNSLTAQVLSEIVSHFHHQGWQQQDGVKVVSCVIGQPMVARRLHEERDLPSSPEAGRGCTAASKCLLSTLRRCWHITPTCPAGRTALALGCGVSVLEHWHACPLEKWAGSASSKACALEECTILGHLISSQKLPQGRLEHRPLESGGF